MTDGHLEGVARPSASALGRLRDAVFPIYGGEETGKFLALGGIQFFIIFVLTLTRDLKDTLIITSCGAEAISFLKVGPSVCARRARGDTYVLVPFQSVVTCEHPLVCSLCT